jgi:aminocarboxymuconate-semialdehyde decarboxylase
MDRVIDVHTHYVPRGWPDLGPGAPWLRLETETDATIMLRDKEFRRIAADCWTPRFGWRTWMPTA